MTELFSSLLVDVSISNSSNKYSALRKSPFKKTKGIKKTINGIDFEAILQK
jgi:hypothetical protein